MTNPQKEEDIFYASRFLCGHGAFRGKEIKEIVCICCEFQHNDQPLLAQETSMAICC